MYFIRLKKSPAGNTSLQHAQRAPQHHTWKFFNNPDKAITGSATSFEAHDDRGGLLLKEISVLHSADGRVQKTMKYLDAKEIFSAATKLSAN